ncbi:bifunctional proline dehydrogenase/pyrroline-5-carboxylate dehydrogenase [Vibrio ruber DSM 16370]|uniref:Bifunctional proline dehydrogenase/pyrroline-5-carboxylate dehydrogenase n=1 Tax=Vibrio ruber (strain DSM 16370 / JCM 11486 / BCRC 17186 / CECT 7878 / LMG 23124 / VR1) TaxID=1123498 RepID=A0A1R4LSJ8_VIBR1|nr:proline dehydrogenase family protein [Vibrio ruber]SJN59566.1 bifunctional proline dehydrogenase/pyrroline-5-carboxylate dehydrogenase [Vibrio ruber DSM 16370]
MYSRHSNLELFFKYFSSIILSNKYTGILSVKLFKWLITQGVRSKFHNIIYKIYFGGESINEAIHTSDTLSRDGTASLLDYAVEGIDHSSGFQAALDNTISLIKLSSQKQHIPFVVIKPSSIGSSLIYQKISHRQCLSTSELNDWNQTKQRYEDIFEMASQHHVKVMVDAEQSWIQPAVDELVVQYMKQYNTSQTVIYLTVQCYLKDKLAFLKHCYQQSVQHHFKAGIKLVRGAYLEDERKYCTDMSEFPIFSTKEETDNNYSSAIEFIATNISHFSPFFATHNSESVDKIVQYPVLSHTWSGQLYGLSDHLTNYLKQYGFKTSKYIPYGPMESSLPYLLRRIEESSISTKSFLEEQKTIKKEIKNRLFHKKTPSNLNQLDDKR